MHISTVGQLFLADLNASTAGLDFGSRSSQYMLVLGFAHPWKYCGHVAYMHPHLWYKAISDLGFVRIMRSGRGG